MGPLPLPHRAFSTRPPGGHTGLLDAPQASSYLRAFELAGLPAWDIRFLPNQHLALRETSSAPSTVLQYTYYPSCLFVFPSGFCCTVGSFILLPSTLITRR